MNRIKSINRVFLATVMISILGLFINSYVYEFTRNYALIMLLSQIIIALPSVIYLILNKIDVFKAIRLKHINIGNIILLILFSYLITPLMGLINMLSTRVVSSGTEQIMSEITISNSLLTSLLLIAVVPSIMEEVVYRGIFYNEFRKLHVMKGIFLSGFLFGIIHGNFNQFSYAFAMGIVFALLIEATDSILSTMIVHFFINGTSVVMMYLLPKLFNLMESLYGEEYSETAVNVSSNSEIGLPTILGYAVYAAVATGLAFIVFRTIAKRAGRWEYIKNIFKPKRENIGVLQEGYYQESDKAASWSKNFFTPSLIVGIVICFILMFLNEEPVMNIILDAFNLT